MIVFTCNEFEKDLSNYQVSFQEKNSWFGPLFSIISFPIDIELEGYFEIYKSDLNSDYPSIFTGVLNRNGKLSSAKLKITELGDHFARVVIESGLEQFPSWDTKLADLPLQQLTVADIRTHASEVITKTYPEVNYNFPMIHCDSYDANNPVWEHFEKVYNKRVDGAFVTNSLDVPNNEVYNKNIMRAFPYAMHILEVGVSAGNCVLHGQVKTDQDYNEAVVIPAKHFEVKDRPESINWIIGIGDVTFIDGSIRYGVFEGEQEILHYGKFRIKGSLLQTPLFKEDAVLYLNDVEIWRSKIWRGASIDLVFTTRLNESNILRLVYIGDTHYDDIELEITPLELWDEEGNEIKYLADSNVIDLRYLVPDVTFGQFVTYLMAQKNYSFDLKNGNEIHMDIKEQNVLPNNAIDLRAFEIRDKKRTLSTVDSFEIKYKDTGNDKYPAEKIFYNIDGAKTSDYQTNDLTQEIEIPGVVLPIETSTEITTARLISNDETAICLALYNGLQNGLNITKNVDHFRLQQIVQSYYTRWFNFQLKAIAYTFSFRNYTNDLQQFEIHDKLFTYDQYHFVTERSVTRVGADIDEYEVKTLSIRA